MRVDSLHKFLGNKHVNFMDRFILNKFAKCKKFLRGNKDILVTKANKGQVTVIMNSNDYITRMNDVQSDQSAYRRLKKNLIKQQTSKINDLVKAWRDKNIIDIQIYRLYINI